MNKIFIMVLAALLAVSFTQCKKEIKNYSFEVKMPEKVNNGWADRDSLTIPVEITFNGYDMSETRFNLSFIQITSKGQLFFDGKQIEEGKEFPITSPKFNLKFYARNNGQYQLKFKFSNTKGFSQEKEVVASFGTPDYSFRVDTVEFPHDSMLYQGVKNSYRFAIKPIVEDLTGYKIKFENRWADSLKIYDKEVEVGKYYDIKNIDNIPIQIYKINPDTKGGFICTIVSNKSGIEVKDTIDYKIKRNIISFDNLIEAKQKDLMVDISIAGFRSGMGVPCNTTPTGLLMLASYVDALFTNQVTHISGDKLMFNCGIIKKPRLSDKVKIISFCAERVIYKNNFVSFNTEDANSILTEKELSYDVKTGRLVVDVTKIINKSDIVIWVYLKVQDEFGNNATINILIKAKHQAPPIGH